MEFNQQNEMSMSPLVSIIIPVYNTAPYLRECLDSVCNQTYRNLEIICVDDGSTDGSLAILREYAKKDSRVILLTQVNSGQAVARNAGLKIATGEWIGGLDSDDYFEKDAIEKCMLHIDEDVEIIQFATRLFRDNGETINESWIEMKYEGKIELTDTIIPKIIPHFVDKLWSRPLLQRCNIFFPVGVYFEDLCFSWSVLSLANKMYCLPEKLYHYRRRCGSTMGRFARNKREPRILDFLKVSETCLSFWQRVNIREKYGCERPAYFELEILNRSRDRITRWAHRDFQFQAWKGICNLIDNYNLSSRLHEFPDLAIYYQLPPYLQTLRKDMLLLASEHRIFWKYSFYKLLGHVSWGRSRCKYKAKKRHYHNLLEHCRTLKKEVKKLFLN